MLIAASLKQLLEKHRLTYRVLPHKRVSSIVQTVNLLNIDPHQLLNVHILADYQGQVLIVLPITRALDLPTCNNLLRRDLKVLPTIEVNRIFKDCEANSWPAVGQIYNIELILDASLKDLEQVFFASGSHTALLQMSLRDYLVLNPSAKILNLSIPIMDMQTDVAVHNEQVSLAHLEFPQLPPVAMQLLQLAIHNENAIQELITLIANDPQMQQQVMLYAQLPLIQARYQAQTTDDPNMQQVVEHILGFEMVSHIALSVAAGRAFNAARISDIEDFWRHALYAAAYAKGITELINPDLNLDPAISYMSGLFHNFGLLLFSQLYPPEYRLLKKWMVMNPKVSIHVLEQRVLGMGQAFNVVRGGHAQLGEWLLRTWNMPDVICVITREHHSTTYNGPHMLYVKIIQLTNQLLRIEGIGDGTLTGVSEHLLAVLGLDLPQVQQCIEQIKINAAGFDNMARSLTNSK